MMGLARAIEWRGAGQWCVWLLNRDLYLLSGSRRPGSGNEKKGQDPILKDVSWTHQDVLNQEC